MCLPYLSGNWKGNPSAARPTSCGVFTYPNRAPKQAFSAMACLDGYHSPNYDLVLRWIPDSRMFHKQEGGRPPTYQVMHRIRQFAGLHDENVIHGETNTLLQRMGLIQDEILPKIRTEKMTSATPETRHRHSQHGCQFLSPRYKHR